MAKGQRKSNKEIRKPKKAAVAKSTGLNALPNTAVQQALKKDG